MDLKKPLRGLLDPGGIGLGTYSTFERMVGLVLSIAVSVIIVFALVNLLFGVVDAVTNHLTGFDYKVFQGLFEMIVTVLIALEFNHTLTHVVAGRGSLVQVKVVVLIGILVVVRKFILIEIDKTEPLFIMSLGVAVIALGGVYWLVHRIEREREERRDAVPEE